MLLATRFLAQTTAPRLAHENIIIKKSFSILLFKVGGNSFSKFHRCPSSTIWSNTRSYVQERPVVQTSHDIQWGRLAIISAGVVASAIVANGFLNRETRESLTIGERSYLNESFQYTGAGLGITAITARSLFKTGHALRIMSANPWAVLGASLVGSLGSMMGVLYTPPETTIQKHLFWLAFNACQGATMSPLFFLSPAVLSRAALYTCGVVGALSYVGATARNEQFLYLGGPLLAGVTVVALSSLSPMALPLGIRSLAAAEIISLYGGLAVFGGFVLYDTQKNLYQARLVEQGFAKGDALNSSISLQLDMVNIFIRLVQILSMRNQHK